FTVNVGTNAVSGTVTETTTDGTYTFIVTNTTIETVTVTITADGVTLDDQPTIEFQAGAASEMSINQQPTATTAGEAIAPAPAVEVTDGTNPVSGVNVTAILSSNDFTATSTVVVTTNGSGIAEFGNLVIETAATGYTITFDADAAGVANVDSDPFDVTAASAAVLNEVSGSGQSAQINQTLSSPFVVEVVDGFGNPVSGETVDFSIVAAPTDAAGQSLSEASVVTGANGQAASTLTLGDKVGAYGVDADWSTSTVSFTADAESGDATAMSVSTQPSATTAGAAIAGPPAVAVVDAGGNPVSGLDVTVSEQGGYILDGGTTTVATDASGIATFSDLVIEAADTYALVFSATGLADITSDPFNVDPAAVSSSASTATATSPHTADGSDASTVTI
ncbi:MAG: carboxypeptidase-like regulatory domain-containing protein, partial [Actinobacteria bacterium]|nr:carboxypeptidase-like regulatory domain-containing protein [Actinomycetota bacterium]